MLNFRAQFIHESVRQYILSQPSVMTSNSDPRSSVAGFAHNALALSCFNYIKAVCVEAEVIKEIAVLSMSTIYERRRLNNGLTRDRCFLQYATRFGFEHAEMAEAGGFPQSYLFDANNNGPPSSMPWWIPFTKAFKIYRKPDVCYDHHLGYSKLIMHWSELINGQMAFADAFKLNSWVRYFLAGIKTVSDEMALVDALCVTAISGDEESLDLLIQAGVNVNRDDLVCGSALHLSLVRRRDDLVAILLSNGAGANVGIGSEMHNPLATATLCCSVEIVRLLLNHGAEVVDYGSGGDITSLESVRDLGMTFLDAATTRDPEIMKVILDAAEHQQVPVELYKAAYVSAQAQSRHDHVDTLKSTVTRLFPEHKTVPLSIKTYDGYRRVEMWSDARIVTLENLISRLEGMHTDLFMLVHTLDLHTSMPLRDDRTLRDYNIQAEMTIHMLPRARWGGQGMHGG